MKHTFNKFVVLVLVTCLLLSGCAIYNRHNGLDFIKKYNNIDPSHLHSMSNEELIEDFRQTYYYAGKQRRIFHERLTSELKRRLNLSDIEIDYIEKQQIFKGMSEKALFLSWGYPRETREKSIDGLGICNEYVYGGEGTGLIPQYIYLRNSTITGWQFKRPRYRIFSNNVP